jgi:DNA invertase Pin-like site-specific DNA recombinase
MLAIGYVRVSTDRQAEKGFSLEAQTEKIRAMAVVQGAELVDVIMDGGESAKSLNRPGMQQLLALIDNRRIDALIVAKLDRLTRSVKDLCGLLELFEKRGAALVSVAESLDTGSRLAGW